jgi:Heparinase II/III-like protein/Heparinase II/III N-terminus
MTACLAVNRTPSVWAPAMRLEAARLPSQSNGEAAPQASGTEPAGHPEQPSSYASDLSGSRARLAWYVRRLQCMSAQELLWRSSDALRKKGWRLRQVTPQAPSPAPRYLARLVLHGSRAEPRLATAPRFESTLPAGALDSVPASDARQLVLAADEILAGRWGVLGVVRQDLVAPDWFLDPLSGRRAPQADYCFSISYRDATVTGNVKQVWELSRHHHLTVLAAAYALTGDSSYAERARSHLQSWWEANPFLSGIHWTSGIELGIRLISWVWTRRLLDGWDGVEGLFEQNPLALKQIWWHQTYLSGFRSRGSSANNHVVAEAAGQMVAALAFPWFEESAGWAEESASLLQQELANNTFQSGVNRELAFDYHGLVAELGLIAAAEADHAGRPLPDSIWRSLGQMLDAAAACLDCGLRAPRQGDSDDGRALVIASPESNRWEALLALGQALIGVTDWWPPTRPGIVSTLVSALAGHHALADRPATQPWHFGDAGITIFRSQPTDGPEIWCRCDSGPHGFLSIAAHAHADALSIEVRYDGTDILADPGTYCYSSDPMFRRYFRSTIGHNTLEISGQDQSASGGPTMWIRHAESRLTSLEAAPDGNAGRWVAEHYGYRTLDTAVTHRRTVEFDGKRRLIEITDEIDGAGRLPVRLAFHLGPTVVAHLDGCTLALQWRDRDGREAAATMSLPSSVAWSLIRGSSDPVLGWYSPAFGQKVPATDVIGVGSASTGAPLRTRLAF